MESTAAINPQSVTITVLLTSCPYLFRGYWLLLSLVWVTFVCHIAVVLIRLVQPGIPQL